MLFIDMYYFKDRCNDINDLVIKLFINNSLIIINSNEKI